jgi:hypothetical protein
MEYPLHLRETLIQFRKLLHAEYLLFVAPAGAACFPPTGGRIAGGGRRQD